MLSWSAPHGSVAVRPDGIGIATTTRQDGDFAVSSDLVDLDRRRRAVIDLPWVWLNQVHGAEVVVVTAPDAVASVCGTAADAAVTNVPGVALAVQTADCMPVVMYSPEGVLAVAHAGWRGLRAGVVQRVAEVMGGMGASRIVCETGPCIGPECYEFGSDELDDLVASFGSGIVATTSRGTPGLDMHRLLDALASMSGVEVVAVHGGCTACAETSFFSHRARAEGARMATVAWMDRTSSTDGGAP